ncbi:MAG: hypothetical protein JRH20_01665 [Deltaproteobacteria bacterium]|nr:hypothetical protein [Deltaproteobacteria bacterium]
MRGLIIILLPLLTTGCVDLRSYVGSWEGEVVAEEAVRQGFATETRVAPLTLDSIHTGDISATLTTSDGRFVQRRLTTITKAGADVLAGLTFDSDPLRTYLLFGQLDSDLEGAPAMVMLSLFHDDRVQLRIFRGNDLYGVFHLIRRP